jgi:hypothetical protein
LRSFFSSFSQALNLQSKKEAGGALSGRFVVLFAIVADEGCRNFMGGQTR